MNQILPIVGLLVLVVLAVIAWTASLRKQVRRQTDSMREQLHRELILAELGRKLAGAVSALDAAAVIVETADQLLGWDACSVFFYLNDQNKIQSILTRDTINGKKTDVPDTYTGEPSPTSRAVIEKGAKLILRKVAGGPGDPGLKTFGEGRRSASLMFVPMHDGPNVIGVLSIQSYTVDFYNQKKLQLLQFLADHCAGAMERIRAREALKVSHDQLEAQVESRVAELKQSNALLETLLDNAPDFIYFKDTASRFTRINRAFLEKLGVKDCNAVLGKTDLDFLAPDYADEARADEEKIMRTGQPLLDKEEHEFWRNGAEFWVNTIKMPLRDQNGTIIGTFGISRDVTARKHAELALAKHEQEQRVIFDSVPAMICYKDTQNTNRRVNKFAAELIGLPVEKIEGRTDFELMPQYADDYYRDDLEVMESGQPKIGIIQPYLRASGETRWLQTDKIPYRDPAGKVVGVIVFATDITERKLLDETLKKAHDELEKRVEERTGKLSRAIALLKQEIAERQAAEIRNEAFSHLGQQLSLATNATAAAHIILAVADKLLGWDAAYLHLFTADLKQNIPILMFDLIDGQRTEVEDKDIEFTARDRRTMEHGAELVNTPSADSLFFGDARPCASRIYAPIRNGTKVIGVMSTQSYTENAYDDNDLNIFQALADFCAGTLERIQAEQSLRQSEERFSKAFRSSPMPMSLTDLATGTILDVNDSLFRFFSWTREEMLGRTALELGLWLRPEDRAAMTAQLQEKKFIREWPCQMRTKTGSVREVLLSVEPMNFSGQPNILAIIQDVTDRLNLEAQLRQSQKMEAIGQLAAGVAHDFNNVLTIIQGHSGLLLHSPDTPASAHRSLTQISAAAERAGSLTRQLLTFSRKQVMQPQQLDLNTVVGGAAQMLQRLLGESISLQFDYSTALPGIEADPGMMEQIIINLAVNSRDAMAANGKLTIATSVVTIDAGDVQRNPEARAGRFACLSVIDNGTGMDATTLGKIFEPFFTTKQVGKGTGLGLATVYGIVKQHQGWIEVISKLGEGTTFNIFLPISNEVVAPAASAAASGAIPVGTETILVVEDEFALRELVRSLLEHFGYRVIEAAHGKEALKIWHERRTEIDLLLTDMMMPEGLSGWDLAELIHKEKPDLKVIYTSGYSVDLFGPNHSLREGVNFLPKPYHPRTLAKAVRECLDS